MKIIAGVPVSILLICNFACDRGRSAPAGQSAKPAPSTQPALPSAVIAQQTVNFPPAHLELKHSDSGLVVTLYTQDPIAQKATIGYYFDMELEPAEPDKLDNAVWSFKSEDSDRVESPNGIFLDHPDRKLQPMDVHADFHQVGKSVTVHLAGKFAEFDDDDAAAAARIVPVTISLIAQLD